MTLPPDAAGTLRRALATAVVVPVTPYLADGNPDSLPADIKNQISGILASWGMR